MTREGEKNGFSVESRGKSAPRNPCTGRKLIFFTMNRNSDVWQACVGEIRVRRRRLECEIVGLLVRNPEERFYFSYLSSFPRIYIYIYIIQLLNIVSNSFIHSLPNISASETKNQLRIMCCTKICNEVYSSIVWTFFKKYKRVFHLWIVLNFFIGSLRLSKINIRYRVKKMSFQK